MKTFLPLLLAIFSVFILASPPGAHAADEKPDLGPAPSPEESRAIDELTKHGVLASPIASGYNWLSVNFRSADKPEAPLFSQLKTIPSVLELDLASSQFSPADLANISALRNLAKLNLAMSNVTDDALSAIEKLDKLGWLNLFSTGITDAGLAHLQGLKNLRRIYLFQTKVSDAGVDALQKALPELRIDRGWDMKPVNPTSPPTPAQTEGKKTGLVPPTPEKLEGKKTESPVPPPEDKKPAPSPTPRSEDIKENRNPPAQAPPPPAPAAAAPAIIFLRAA